MNKSLNLEKEDKDYKLELADAYYEYQLADYDQEQRDKLLAAKSKLNKLWSQAEIESESSSESESALS